MKMNANRVYLKFTGEIRVQGLNNRSTHGVFNKFPDFFCTGI